MRIFFTLSIILFFSVRVMSQSSQPVTEAPAVKFYPNPAISYIIFDFPREIDRSYSFEVYNFLGKKVFEQKSIQSRTTIDLAQYFRGVYIFQVRDKTGKIIRTGRFQVLK